MQAFTQAQMIGKIGTAGVCLPAGLVLDKDILTQDLEVLLVLHCCLTILR